MWDHDRKIAIYTNQSGAQRKLNFDVTIGIPAGQIPVSRNGLDKEVQKAVKDMPHYQLWLRQVIQGIEQKDPKTVLLTCETNCQASVVLAENLREYYPKATITHLGLESKR